jgi:hypothetical protein
VPITALVGLSAPHVGSCFFIDDPHEHTIAKQQPDL